MNAPAKQNPIQQNAIARAMLQQSALPIRKRIGLFGPFAPGDTARIRLLNVGLTTAVQARVSTTLTTTGTVTNSALGPYPLTPQVVLTDYNQIERVNTDAYSLQALRAFKRRRLDDLRGTTALNPGNASAPAFSAFPTGVVTDAPLSYFIDVPLAVDADLGDLRGMSLSQAVVGEQFLSIKMADSVLGADPTQNIVTGGTTASVGDIYVEVWQEYLQPQNMQSLPMLDLSTIYEVKGLFRSSSDIQTSGQKLINYPNVRTVMSSLHVCIDDDAGMDNTQINTIQLLANSSQILREDSYYSRKRAMLDEVLGEVGAGVIYMNHRAAPISTAIYGNVQMALNFATITGGNTFVLSQFESVYASGTPLPGISTQ